MKARSRAASRRRGLLAGCLIAALAACGLLLGAGRGGVQRAAGLSGASELAAQTDDSLPLSGVTLFGASPGEAAGEVWGIGSKGGSGVLVTYTQAGGWTTGPRLQDSGGEPLSGFQLDTPEAFAHEHPSPLAGSMAARGSGALLGTVGTGASSRQAILIREPGGPFKEVTVPEGEEGLAAGETLFGVNSPPLLAALDEEGGKAGAFVVPSSPAVESAVLHWDGAHWTRETIEVPAAGSSRFEVMAIAASSSEDAWLLGRMEGPSGELALFRRKLGGGGPTWRPVTTRPGGEPGEGIQIAGETLEVPRRDQSQLLTVTSAGVWVDGRLRAAQGPATLYFRPEGESLTGSFAGLWCTLPSGASGAAPGVAAECAEHPLPEPLPTDYSRSFAWAGSAGFGERIVTGFKDGQLMRLEGSRFALVNTLGGEAGGTFGAAFGEATDGWLGKRLLPVHVTTPANLAPSRLRPWPVPFRFALTALASQPGAPIGAASSEVLAVGDRGEVARYHPGQGWFPETLPGPGGKRMAPRLRAVAWPTPERAFAVGDSERGAGQMWLWRGETKLWEKDPAIPLNFRGNLLGIAFDPNNAARGYAVGQQGVLLSYGKTWTQEPESLIPPAARGASFTSIAFAGSEAIVVWRKLVKAGQNSYTGGVIVNDGSGWREDEGADAVLGTNAVPWAVAGLPDGGAAFTAESPVAGATIYERSSPADPWHGVAYPGGFAPGAIALFREGEALRAVGTGSEPATFVAEEETPPPPGFPPILVQPYPLVSDVYHGVLRQTAGGWRDEEHELNDAAETPGGYVFWDTPDIPDPVNAVLVDPTGAQGWAVGGIVDNKHPLLDTADIDRYPADGLQAPGEGASPEHTGAGNAAIAIGGGAACAAPCATRSDTGIGPDVWLHNAIEEAGGIGRDPSKPSSPGSVGAFVYSGPGVTDGLLTGPRLFPVPWQAEEGHYAQRLSGGESPVCSVAAPTDREGLGEGSEGFYDEQVGGSEPACHAASDGEGDYAFDSHTPKAESVRVILLDTSRIQGGQREVAPAAGGFLTEQLEAAKGRAIVVGNADLPREYSEGRPAARELVAIMEARKAAAYVFDAPERNVQETLTGSEGGVPAFGSGTLGYVNVLNEEQSGFIGQSGFLLLELPPTPNSKGVYKPTVKLIPNIAELAVEAQQGTLLRRSQVASFAGLARRPRSGNRAHNQQLETEVAPYIQIPANCLGSGCAVGIEPEYRFSSSNTEYGEFVKRNLNSPEPNAVEHDAKGHPVSEEAAGGKSGLFCAFNKTPAGEPVYVTLQVANLSYRLPVTIQGGSVRQPCGTTPLHNKLAVSEPSTATPPGPASGPAPASAGPTTFNVPLPQAPVVPHPAPKTPLPQFIPQPTTVAFLPPFVPVPLPTPARPTPPSGTSPVTSPVEAAQKEDEEEAAPESVDAAASAYHPTEHETPPVYLIGLVVLAAFAGASLRGRRRPRREIKVAPATVNTFNAQRRWDRDER